MSTDTTGIVGREAESARLEAAVGAVAAGAETRVLLLTGEPGIGKSALLDALAARAGAAGLTVLRARAAEQERDVPFALAVEALDDAVADLHPSRQATLDPELAGILPSLVGDVDASPASAAQRFRAHRALRAALEELATTAPVALLLDDLHWADQASLEWMLHALRRPARKPHLIALGAREVDPLPLLLDAARSVPGAEHLALAPLADDAARALLADVPEHRRERLVAEAGGNPLYLEGLARTSGDRLPATVMAAVAAEISELPPASRTLLEGAAVVGDPFEADLAAVAAGVGQDAHVALDALAARGLVAARPDGRLRFRHPLVRRAVYDAAPAGWRIAAHGRLAAALQERGVDAVGRAHHVEQAASVGDAEAARTLADAAGATAGRAPETAVRWHRAALRLDPAAPPEVRLGRLEQLAEALGAMGRLDEAREVLLEVLAAVPAEAVAPRLELIAGIAELEQALGRHEDAIARIEHALDGVADPPPALRARLTYELAQGALNLDDNGRLSDLAGQSADALRATEPALAVADEAAAVVAANGRGDHQAAARWLERARSGLRGLSDAERAARPTVVLEVGWAEFLTGHIAEAAAVAAGGLADIQEGGQDRLLAPLAILHSGASWLAGDQDAALASVDLGEEAARLQNVDFLLQWSLWHRCLIQSTRGEREAAQRAGEECLVVSARVGDLPVTRMGRCFVAATFAETDPARTVREIEAAAGPALDGFVDTEASFALEAYVRALIALGRADDAEVAVRRLEEQAVSLGQRIIRARARHARAHVALAAGDAATAGAAAADAMAVADADGFGMDAAFAAVTRGRALAGEGRRDEAIAALRDAAQRGASGAMWAVRDAAARELRRLGSRLDAATQVADAHGLTDRERQVADHVAAGRSNKEIAALLFLSPKTIEHTLTRVYAKVGVRSRTGLTALRS